jgi:pyruvate-ferredoxin/flavodoxin oxidoreductase
MGKSQTEQKSAVLSGYWNNFRYDPRLLAEGKNPFMLDSKAPSESYQEFLKNEVRYSALIRQNPDRAEELFEQAEKQALAKYEHLKRLEALYSVNKDQE